MASSEATLLRLLRARLVDDRHSRLSFVLRVDDRAARSATVEIANGSLRTSVAGASRADDLGISLFDSQVATIRGLIDYLNMRPGYVAEADRQYDGDHPSSDLRIEGLFGNLLGNGVAFYHRRFSDAELFDILKSACTRHNITYSPENVPEGEHQFVLAFAHSEALRVLATNAAKRRGLSETVQDLLAISDSLERSNQADVRRQQRAVPVPEVAASKIGAGDIILGQVSRQSLRTGMRGPIASALPPDRPVLHEPAYEDVEDTSVRLTWDRMRTPDLLCFEIWRDVREDVRRQQTRRPSTSRMVYRSQNSTARAMFRTVAFDMASHSNLRTEYTDGIENESGVRDRVLPLDPDTTYYYRLYAINTQGEMVDSDVIGVTTKPMRAQLADTSPLDVLYGPLEGGTEITFTGSNFHEGMTIHLGDKLVTELTIVSATEATGLSPAYNNSAMDGVSVDVVVTSTTGLAHVTQEAFEYRA